MIPSLIANIGAGLASLLGEGVVTWFKTPSGSRGAVASLAALPLAVIVYNHPLLTASAAALGALAYHGVTEVKASL